jgi:hypothetical protein
MKFLKPIEQIGPTCAFASLAMVTGKTIDNIVNIIGSTEPFCLRKLQRTLIKMGIKSKIHRSMYPLPLIGVAVIDHSHKLKNLLKKQGKIYYAHMIAYYNNMIYDPNVPYPIPLRIYEDSMLTNVYGAQIGNKQYSASWAGNLEIFTLPDNMITSEQLMKLYL